MKKKKEYLSHAHHFLKPEAFLAEMMANGFPFNDLKLVSDSNFKKSFRNEIESVVFRQNEDTQHQEMELVINRDGIYDRLPEGIFHQTRGNSKTLTTAQMTEEHRRFREEERMARNFFQPLEQEIFRFSTLVEQEERNLAFGILNGDLKNELRQFWEIPEGLPEECMRKLVQVMPWARKIKGDPEQTARALEIILSRPVHFERHCLEEHRISGKAMGLGEGQLGIDTVVGMQFTEPVETWTFHITEVGKQEIASYVPSGPHGKLLKQFEEIFIPLEIDIIFDYEVLPAADPETEDVLGFSLVL